MSQVKFLITALLLLLMAGCGTDLHKPVTEEVKGGAKIVDVEGALIKQFLIENNVSGVNAETTVFGQKAYKILYDSFDIHGNPIKASGYMVVPKGMSETVEKTLGFSVVIDDHGTIFNNQEAPTVMPELSMMPGQDTSVIFTSLGGFVTLMPDYVGYAESLGAIHPFILKEQLAKDTIAFVKAAQKFALNNHINLNGQLFLTGYSEGGYAAMATLQKSEEEDALEISLAIPMAGPYDLTSMSVGVLSKPQLSVPSFMAYVAYAYANAYDEPVQVMVNAPYADKLPFLFDGKHTREEIDAELTTKTSGEDGLFNSLFVNDFFTNSTNWFKQAVLENDVHNWAPQTPVRLLHCQGDDVIPYVISELTKTAMQSKGASDVELIPVEAAMQAAGVGDGTLMGHSVCGQYAYGLAMQIFAQTRQQTVGY